MNKRLAPHMAAYEPFQFLAEGITARMKGIRLEDIHPVAAGLVAGRPPRGLLLGRLPRFVENKGGILSLCVAF